MERVEVLLHALLLLCAICRCCNDIRGTSYTRYQVLEDISSLGNKRKGRNYDPGIYVHVPLQRAYPDTKFSEFQDKYKRTHEPSGTLDAEKHPKLENLKKMLSTRRLLPEGTIPKATKTLPYSLVLPTKFEYVRRCKDRLSINKSWHQHGLTFSDRVRSSGWFSGHPRTLLRLDT